MTEYFYTLDLGETYGQKLNRLAILSRHEDDIEGFAAVLLQGALDQLEAQMQREDEAAEAEAKEWTGRGGPMDDGIPF